MGFFATPLLFDHFVFLQNGQKVGGWQILPLKTITSDK